MKKPPLFSFLAAVLCFPALMAQGVLTAPKSLTATDGEYADTIVVSWKVVPGADRYRVFSNDKDDWLTAVGVGSTEDTVFFDVFREQKPEGPRYYWVVAERHRERSPFSQVEEGSTAAESENYFDRPEADELRPSNRRMRPGWRLRRLRQGLPRR